VHRGTATESLDSAAQQVWNAFDVATILTKDRCAIVYRVEVQIEVRSRSDQELGRIRAAVDVTDLEAFDNGNLSENEFIDQVAYEAIPVGDQAGNQ
jgi:hypothetical protein